MANFNITVGESAEKQGQDNSLCVSNVGVPEDATKTFKCTKSLIGRYLHIRTNLKESLLLCEVKVFGEYV